MEKEIAVIAEFHAQKDNVGEAVEILQSLVNASRPETGCVYFALYQDPEINTRFMLVERWTSYATWQDHLDSDHVKNTQKAIGSCLAEPISIRWANIVA